MMSEMPNLKAKYREEVAPALMQKFNYKSTSCRSPALRRSL